MFNWIYDVHNAWLVVLFSIAFIGFGWAGAVMMRPRLLGFVRDQDGVNRLVGSILSCYAVFYGLLLGLIAVATYQNYAETDDAVGREAAQLTALYRDVSNYPQPERKELQTLLRDYARYVIEEAWPDLKKGLVDVAGGPRLEEILARLAAFEPRTKGQEILHAETLHAFNTLSALRRQRVFSANASIPAIMWYVMIGGAILNLVIVWLFDLKVIAHLFLGGMLSLIIGSVICLIAAMDRPYRGDAGIGPDAFREVYANLMQPAPDDDAATLNSNYKANLEPNVSSHYDASTNSDSAPPPGRPPAGSNP